MTDAPLDTEELLRRVGRGDPTAAGDLFRRHRKRLRRMVGVRIDHRLAARVDPSDVVQEALAEAAQRLPEYLRDRPLPFFPWLRQLAWDRLSALYRTHVRTARRSVNREEPPALPDESVLELVDRLLVKSNGPSAGLRRQERRALVRRALEQLPERDREVLVLRQLEELSVAEVAAVLGIGVKAVYARQLKALERLREALSPELGGSES
jgi:RNA polymerase sigma-70 factor, ECF subfamily